MSNNYSNNDNHASNVVNCIYSHNNNNSDQLSTRRSQVYLNDKIGLCNSNNSDNYNNTSILVRILVVDDEPDISFILKAMLEKRNGFRVDSFNNPEEALHNFKPGVYDLLIVDIKMPKINGMELYNKIRKVDENIRVCFLSANEQYYEDTRNQLPASIQTNYYFLQKPFRNEELIQNLDKLIA
jgi:CheY-like chemotaxis protein